MYTLKRYTPRVIVRTLILNLSQSYVNFWLKKYKFKQVNQDWPSAKIQYTYMWRNHRRSRDGWVFNFNSSM